MALNPAVKRRFRRCIIWIGLSLAAIGGVGDAAAISDRIAHDPYTGIAIGGYDPVAYFIDGRAVPGKRDIEVSWGGGYWRFANPGNAAAFQSSPDVYAPSYGGYGTTGVARGIPQPSDPRLFAVWQGRLFLFFEAGDLEAFVADPESIAAAADTRWPRVREQLAD